MINITLNGRKESLDKDMTILALLTSKKIRPEVVTVELNDDIVDRKKFKATPIRDGDRLEFVYFMGGGMLNFEVKNECNSC